MCLLMSKPQPVANFSFDTRQLSSKVDKLYKDYCDKELPKEEESKYDLVNKIPSYETEERLKRFNETVPKGIPFKRAWLFKGSPIWTRLQFNMLACDQWTLSPIKYIPDEKNLLVHGEWMRYIHPVKEEMKEFKSVWYMQPSLKREIVLAPNDKVLIPWTPGISVDIPTMLKKLKLDRLRPNTVLGSRSTDIRKFIYLAVKEKLKSKSFKPTFWDRYVFNNYETYKGLDPFMRDVKINQLHEMFYSERVHKTFFEVFHPYIKKEYHWIIEQHDDVPNMDGVFKKDRRKELPLSRQSFMDALQIGLARSMGPRAMESKVNAYCTNYDIIQFQEKLSVKTERIYYRGRRYFDVPIKTGPQKCVRKVRKVVLRTLAKVFYLLQSSRTSPDPIPIELSNTLRYWVRVAKVLSPKLKGLLARLDRSL